jgi:hypothetical protein
LSFENAISRIVHGIASFLLTHLDFEGEGLPERAVEFAKNTLAHFLADDETRLQIEDVFRNIANSLLAHAATDEVRQALRRSPIAPRSVEALRAWLIANDVPLTQAAANGTLAVTVIPIMLQHNRHSTVTALSKQEVIPSLVHAWIRGDTFATILGLMSAANVRIGGKNRFSKIEDAIALCEGGLAYEGAMIVATLADLSEGVNGALCDAFKLLQRQIKAGLVSAASLGMYEVGFSDREIAKGLAGTFPNVTDYNSARAWIRANADLTRNHVAPFPAYFSNVLEELIR